MSVAGIQSSASTLYHPSPTSLLPEQIAQVIAYMLRPTLRMNQFIQYIPVTKMSYIWYRLSRDDSIRVPAGMSDAAVWADGQSRKGRGKDKGTRFAAQTGELVRRDEAVNVGWLTASMNDYWPVLQTELENIVSRMLTMRSQLIWNAIPNAAWTFPNTQPANSLNGGLGNWKTASDDPGSPHFNAIQQTLLNAVRYIELMTNGAVTQEDLVLVLNYDDAIQIANSPEIRHVLNVNQQATIGNQGFVAGQQNGLPVMLYGVRVVVENSAIVTSLPLANGVEATVDVDRTWIMPSGTAYLLSRPGSLLGAPGSRSFSTVQVYHLDSLIEVEVFPDTQDRLTEAHCCESIDIQLPAIPAAMQITNILG